MNTKNYNNHLDTIDCEMTFANENDNMDGEDCTMTDVIENENEENDNMDVDVDVDVDVDRYMDVDALWRCRGQIIIRFLHLSSFIIVTISSHNTKNTPQANNKVEL